jgi:rare lipoprotein A
MMTKRFYVALLCASAMMWGLTGGVLARNAPRGAEPPQPIATWVSETGTASYYGAAHNGRRSADGSRFDEMALTAAHPWLPFGTKVRVTLAGTDRTVIVTITDRLYSSRRIVDLSFAAACQIGIIHPGLGQVTLNPA